MYKIDQLRKLWLGRQGENISRPVLIDVSEWLVRWPGARIVAVYRRNGDVSFYELETAVKDGVLGWLPTRTDLFNDGHGELIIRAMDGELEYKSAVVDVMVDYSPDHAVEENPPDPLEGWFERVLTASGEARTSALEAKSAAAEAQKSETKAAGYAEASKQNALSAEKYNIAAGAAAGKSEAAAEEAEAAKNGSAVHAANARESELAAGEHAGNAEQSATASKQYSEAAGASANTATDKATEAAEAQKSAEEAAGNAKSEADRAQKIVDDFNPVVPAADLLKDDAIARDSTWSSRKIAAEVLDAKYAAMLDDTNTSRLFAQWWNETQDSAATRYERLARWFQLMCNDGQYTVRFYNASVSGDPAGVALDDLEPLGAAPISANGEVPVADWTPEHRLTWYIRVNGLQTLESTLDVLYIEGEEGFDITGEIAPVYTVSPALFRRCWTADGYDYKSWRTTAAEGYAPMPEAVMPGGEIRPFVWHSTFGGCLTTSGNRLTSGAGRKINNFTSANTAITQARAMGAYEGLWTDCDHIWLLDQWQLRHQNKENSNILDGCQSYNVQYVAALAETGVRRVLVTTAQAANFIVGSAVCVGDRGAETATDRNNVLLRNVVADALIESIETVEVNGASYGALNLALDADIATTATCMVSTMPWHTGSTESIPGHSDGSPGSATNGKYPFRLAGVERMEGAYVVGLDPLWRTTLTDDGGVTYEIFSQPDSTKQAGDAGNYLATGITQHFTAEEKGKWMYIKEMLDNGKILFPTLLGAGSTTYYKSAFYATTWAGVFCPWRWMRLNDGGAAGLAGLNGNLPPSGAYWAGLPRLGGSGARRAAG